MRCVTTFVALGGLVAGGLARGEEPTPVSLRVGETLNVCKARLVQCPVSSFLCDDPKVAIVENSAEGAVLKGVSAGTTVCALLGFATATRGSVRVTVSADPKPKP